VSLSEKGLQEEGPFVDQAECRARFRSCSHMSTGQRTPSVDDPALESHAHRFLNLYQAHFHPDCACESGKIVASYRRHHAERSASDPIDPADRGVAA